MIYAKPLYTGNIQLVKNGKGTLGKRISANMMINSIKQAPILDKTL